MTRGAPDWKPWTAVQRFSEAIGAQLFEQKITVPANTVIGAPESQSIDLIKGFIAHVEVRFPTGPAGLLHIAIFDEATQLWPGTVDTWFSGDNESISFDTEYVVPLVVADYKLTAQGYNEDDSYEHVALIRVWVVKLPP